MPRPAITHIHLDNLRHNYRLLKRTAKDSEIMTVVKANAYGHELFLVAPALLEEGCTSFAVTDATEGCELRSILGFYKKIEIVLLSGIFDEEDAELACQHQLTPTISELQQVHLLKQAGFNGNVWIKIDSGMNRLGAKTPKQILEACFQAEINVCGLMSHLACADEPNHQMNQKQAVAFNEMCDQISPELPRSLLNSAGIISMPEHTYHTVRPGIALYGAEPVAAQPIGLKPVMTLTGEIMQVRDIPAGVSVSYGATFTADQAMTIAVVGLGYADGVPRSLSNHGHVFIHSQKLAIVGRVCMDYTMIDVTDTDTKPGDAVEFWGENILANDVARSLDTISYTLFTGVGERVRRKAV
ncbi:alanine racemase [Mariprofundus micogutta]|uniref:Alanine racemase n=1 Tax=Mariprofundus micogutta TaxID=1921010 RepID=A0A1L8CLF4_9PROT|nr:alanine racemase [Mariprofundus micogutta]GAV19734.1 alanine racemase [Mariprofundus micogutta]